MESMNEFWAACQAKLKELVRSTPSIYQLWFGVLEPVSWDPALGKLTLKAPAAKVPYIRAVYLENIRTVATFVNGGRSVTLTLIAAPGQEGENEKPVVDHAAPGERHAQEMARREDAGLIPRFTFEEYVSGSANQLAVAAAQHVAATPGSSYNPLYIYGGVGLGKTHLMHAVGHRYLDLHPNGRIRAVTAQNFINEYTSAVRESAS